MPQQEREGPAQRARQLQGFVGVDMDPDVEQRDEDQCAVEHRGRRMPEIHLASRPVDGGMPRPRSPWITGCDAQEGLPTGNRGFHSPEQDHS